MKSNQFSTLDDLLNLLPHDYPAEGRIRIGKAYHYANDAHQNQKRQSGEPYVTHCVAVACILAQFHVPEDMIIAGLLHDVVEDTNITLQEIEADFGPKVAELVDGVTKTNITLPRVSGSKDEMPTAEQISRQKREASLESLRKMLLTANPRVLLVKLADRLHNMRTLQHTPPDKQKRIAQETLDIYAPLANRLGIGKLKWELEDLGFRYLNPEKYKEIASRLDARREDREREIIEIVHRIRTILAENDIHAEVTGRSKHIFSIYKKMNDKSKTFEQLMDVRAVRIIIDNTTRQGNENEDEEKKLMAREAGYCYQAVGLIHSYWRPIPGEYDDYIGNPKSNSYQSLHTAVTYSDNKPVEVQIRTRKMHEEAEEGIASHWRYKERHVRMDREFEEHLKAMRSELWEKTDMDSQEFADSVKTDILSDRIFVFTPRNDIIELPAGSTPIDFAYHIHTDIGHRCRGAKIGDRIIPLDYVLQNGEKVEILTTKHGGPNYNWLNSSLGMVKTQSARSKIRAWFSKQQREQNIVTGKDTLQKELKRLGVALTNIDVEELAISLNERSPDDFYAALGSGKITIGKLINQLAERFKSNTLDLQSILGKPTVSKIGDAEAISVVGLSGMLTHMARCCGPVPGDDIVGFVTLNSGVTIHRADCPNMLRMRTSKNERIIEVSWGVKTQTYRVPVRVQAYDRQGLILDISNVAKNEGVNMVDLKTAVDSRERRADIADIHVTVEVTSINQLSRLLTRIENLPNVLEASRNPAG